MKAKISKLNSISLATFCTKGNINSVNGLPVGWMGEIPKNGILNKGLIFGKIKELCSVKSKILIESVRTAARRGTARASRGLREL